ncbi:hypothetical protein C2G38_2231349 [Gigaspora rosea]|uniref:Uncharacterized protein n=1 Tax=Gigaspora rosea TaxID=44941 RepID=A0A397TWH8_9GLOM|nr:hypothetical protein C2G38_2231349 [Gigaspora rosea]
MSESNERTLARIIENQGEILSEFKVIKDKVGRIENRLNDLEQKMDNSFDITNDKAFKEDMIKGAAKALIEKAIYSKNSQIKSEAEKYKSTKTNECYQKLFEELEKDSDDTYMNRILHKIWPDSKAPPEKIAYAIAVCQTMLNPKNKIIMISDHIVKKLIAINLNKLEYGRHFSISSSEHETSKEDRDKSDDNDSENDNTEQGSKRNNNSNYSDKQNILKSCDFTNLILKITELVDLDPEEVQEALDEDIDKEKDMDNYEKNTDNDE